MLTDPLAQWFRWDAVVQRFAGAGAYGDVWDAETTVRCGVDDRRRMVRDGAGDEVISETTLVLPATTPDIPPGSLVRLPGRFGGREARVIATSRGDSGGLPTPDHLQVALT